MCLVAPACQFWRNSSLLRRQETASLRKSELCIIQCWLINFELCELFACNKAPNCGNFLSEQFWRMCGGCNQIGGLEAATFVPVSSACHASFRSTSPSLGENHAV